MKHILKFLVLFMLLLNLALMIGFAIDFIQAKTVSSLKYMVLNALGVLMMISCYKTIIKE